MTMTMKRLVLKYISVLLLSVTPSFVASAADADTSTKRERNYIKEGNKLYREGNFPQAEVAYSKALEENPLSEVAAYNYASALVKQAGAADPNNGKNPMAQAQSIFSQLNENAQNMQVAEWAAYNLGNIAFNQQQWQPAIEYYKNALRRNPDNDKARENLRLAQLKKQEEDQKQDQNQDQNQDENQDQQNQQDQQQNQDQKQDQDKNEDKQDQNQQNQQQKEQKQDQQPQKQQQISNSNMQKILDTVEKAEAATRAKVDAEKKKEEAKAAGRPIGNQW